MSTYTTNNLSVGALIKVVGGVDTLLTNFKNEWVAVNSTKYWYGGTSTGASDATRVLAVKYWCHSNCHNDCHSSCHQNRGRR